MPSGEKIPWFSALFKNSTFAGSIKTLVSGRRLCSTRKPTPELIMAVRPFTSGVTPSMARRQRIMPIIPTEKLFTSISKPGGICPSIILSNLLMTHPAKGPTAIAPKNIGFSEATMTPIAVIAPIRPPRSPATTFPPVYAIRSGSITCDIGPTSRANAAFGTHPVSINSAAISPHAIKAPIFGITMPLKNLPNVCTRSFINHTSFFRFQSMTGQSLLGRKPAGC